MRPDAAADAGLDLDDVPTQLRPAALAALHAAGVVDGHVSLQLLDEQEIRELNREHRGRDRPTDVLSFPIDGAGAVAGPREIGDVAICPEQTEDLIEATVHGVLHLCGYDHETDGGEMLELQAEVIRGITSSPTPVDSSASRPGQPPTPVDSSASRPGSTGFGEGR